MSNVPSVKPPYKCASCGHEWADDVIWCPKCRVGYRQAGEAVTARPTDLRQQPGVCPECKGSCRTGSGYLREDCPACNGTGQQPAQPESGEAVRKYPPPLAAEIKALPEHVRGYLHDLETRADPSGDLVAVRAEQDNVRGLSAMVRRLQSSLTAAQRELDEVSAAIGRFGVRYMDPPDGGDVTLGEQVSRMANELTVAQQREAELRLLEALLFDGYSVLQHLAARDRGRTSGENVADTLDALNRAWKAALANTNTVDNLPNGNLPSGDI